MLDIRLCTHLQQLKETGMLSSGWQMYTVACVRIMKNVEVHEYCLGWHVYALWKQQKNKKRTSPRVLLRAACAHILYEEIYTNLQHVNL